MNTTDFVIGMHPKDSQEFQNLKRELFHADGTVNSEAQKDNQKVYRYNCLASARLVLFNAMKN